LFTLKVRNELQQKGNITNFYNPVTTHVNWATQSILADMSDKILQKVLGSNPAQFTILGPGYSLMDVFLELFGI